MDPITLYYGIDVSKDTLHISYQSGIEANGQPQWAYQTLPNELDSLEQWVGQLAPNSHLIFEHTGTYSARLGWVLALHDRPFRILTPNQSKGFATTLKSISKTDRSDATLLARYGQVFHPSLRNWPRSGCTSFVSNTNTLTTCESATNPSLINFMPCPSIPALA